MRQKIGTINFWHVKHMFKEDVWVAGGLGKAFFCSIGCIQGIILLRNVTAKSASRTWDVDGSYVNLFLYYVTIWEYTCFARVKVSFGILFHGEIIGRDFLAKGLGSFFFLVILDAFSS